jgi:Metallopeptidase family M24
MFEIITNPLRRAISKVDALPLLNSLSPSGARIYSEEEKQGYLKSQELAQRCALDVSLMLAPGWTEKQAVVAMETWLRDHGVKSFFHKPFAWWGDRTKFVGVKNYSDYQGTDRRLLEHEPFILDVAPILNGYVSDIGFSGLIGDHAEYSRGIAFLDSLRVEIPKLVTNLNHGASVWRAVDRKIQAAGYENIHAEYPLGVLGHRVFRTLNKIDVTVLNFGWQSYWELASRGIFGQVLNQDYEGPMDGMWAIEPHIGGANWGLKFEEILVVEQGQASWLSPIPHWNHKRTFTR